MKIVVTQNITLDGRIEMLGDWFDPTDQDPELAAHTMELTQREEVLLLGRRTFTDFRGYWPHQTDDTTGVSESLDHADKRVVTSTLTDPEWQNSTIVRGEDLVEHVEGLRAQKGDEVVVTGSIQLTHALAQAGLVDEYRLYVFPAWQGQGRGLFPDGCAPTLERVDARAFTGGVTYGAYVPKA